MFNPDYPWGRVVAAVYGGASVITFLVYAWDKRAAQSGRTRVRERTLHVLELLGGWPGALLAQGTLRHKNRKLGFQCVTWLIVVAHAAGWIWLWRR